MSLAQAIIHNQTGPIMQYLQAGGELDTYDEFGFTPLVETAIMDNQKLAEAFVTAGADVNYKDLTGGTALHWTVENNNYNFTEYLLEQGADANAYTLASEPVLAKVILRQQTYLKSLLVQHGASEVFAKDYINTKLLGHRFSLRGSVDILDPKGLFTEVDLEGFVLEFSLNVIRASLQEFKQNYMARNWKKYRAPVQKIIDLLDNATQLIKMQHYQMEVSNYDAYIDTLLNRDFLLVPLAYSGHAITLVKKGRYVAVCDRRSSGDFADRVTVYRINNSDMWNNKVLKFLLYEKQSAEVIEYQLAKVLELTPASYVIIKRQISGNCSWANVEAGVLLALHMQYLPEVGMSPLLQPNDPVFQFYLDWGEWDRERALHFCIESMQAADKKSRAAKAALLADVLFQRCSANNRKDVERAMRILKILKAPEFQYVLDSYVETYVRKVPTKAGKNFERLLELYDDGLW